MRKKILGSLLVVAIVAVAAFNVSMNTQESEMSLLALANVEALAFPEELKEVVIECGSSSGKCWDEDFEIVWTPFGPSRVTFCNPFTGSQSDYCVSGIPY